MTQDIERTLKDLQYGIDYDCETMLNHACRELESFVKKFKKQQKKPLTDKKINRLLKTMHGEPYPKDLYAFARAIEAAHGIKGD